MGSQGLDTGEVMTTTGVAANVRDVQPIRQVMMMVMLLSCSVSVDVVSGSNIASERVRREDLALG